MPALCAFHYCSLDNLSSQNAPSVFGSILAQMVKVKPEMAGDIRQFRRPGVNSLALPDLRSLLNSASQHFNPFYIVIDALNESTDQHDIVSTLLNLSQDFSNLRVLVTCTLEAKEDNPLIQQTRMGINAVDHDIELYVEHRLATEQSFRSLSRELRSRILSSVTSDADGT
jgi:hypothetical protein